MAYESFENFHDNTCNCQKCDSEHGKDIITVYCKTCEMYYKNTIHLDNEVIFKHNTAHLCHDVIYLNTNTKLSYAVYDEKEDEYVFIKHIQQKINSN